MQLQGTAAATSHLSPQLNAHVPADLTRCEGEEKFFILCLTWNPTVREKNSVVMKPVSVLLSGKDKHQMLLCLVGVVAVVSGCWHGRGGRPGRKGVGFWRTSSVQTERHNSTHNQPIAPKMAFMRRRLPYGLLREGREGKGRRPLAGSSFSQAICSDFTRSRPLAVGPSCE